MSSSQTTGAVAPPSAAQLRQVVHPVDGVPAVVAFYSAASGLPTRFVDGDRYAALNAGSATLALANTEEVAGGTAAAFEVDEVEAFVERLLAAGGQVVEPIADDPHERRVVVCAPRGNRVIAHAAL